LLIAAIGLIGTLSQPILHGIGLLYTYDEGNPIEVGISRYGVDPGGGSISADIRVREGALRREPLRDTQTSDWKTFIGAKQRTDGSDIVSESYPLRSNVISIDDFSGLSVKLNEDLANHLKAGGCYDLTLFAFDSKQIRSISTPFNPAGYGYDVLRIVDSVYRCE
jgi:hypothetical protein